MSRLRKGAVVAFALAGALLLPTPAAAARSTPSAGIKATGCSKPVAFKANRFGTPLKINNNYLPLVVGTRFVLNGFANRTGTALPHEVNFTVTQLTKVVNGVTSRVILDLDINEGQIQEAELAFFAQDNDGNVWSTGEYPEEYEGGIFTGAPKTWISGLDKAEAGLMMLASPKLGGPRYVQGFSPNIDFLDCAQVFATGQRTCVPAACYSNVLVTDENSPLEPDSGHQRKFYAPGVGNVQVTAVDDPEGETLNLTKVGKLNGLDLATADALAVALDVHGRLTNDLYSRTPPVQLG